MSMDISYIALFVSAASLCVSLYMSYRLKGLVAIANTYLDAHEVIGYRLGIYVMNSGVEPNTLRNLVIETYDGQTFRHRFKSNEGQQIRLAQSEFFECFLTDANSEISTWAKYSIRSAKIIDSYGEAWNVKDFSEIINQRHHHSDEGISGSSSGWNDFVWLVKSALNRHGGNKPGRSKSEELST